jgi:SAM-dependent methyltransferase
VLYEDRSRAESFGAIAELYDRVRPSYPSALLDALLVERPARVEGPTRALDVGCGTGIVAELLAQRGCEVLGVEVDERMAAIARARGIDVEVAPFERWDARGRRFELLTSGQAWHWVDPVAGAERAADVLERDATLGLFWNFGSPPAIVAERFDAVYAQHAPGVESYSVLLGGKDRRADAAAAGIAASESFEPAAVRRFPWRRVYNTQRWLALLQTHSDHQTLPPERRARLLAAVGEAIDAIGGSFELPYEAVLVTTRRL